jgi:hypothetical protein
MTEENYAKTASMACVLVQILLQFMKDKKLKAAYICSLSYVCCNAPWTFLACCLHKVLDVRHCTVSKASCIKVTCILRSVLILLHFISLLELLTFVSALLKEYAGESMKTPKRGRPTCYKGTRIPGTFS